MPIRFYIDQYSQTESNTHYRVAIWDSLFIGSPERIVNGGFELQYEGSEADDVDMPIIASTATIIVQVTLDDGKFENMLYELAGADEERFHVRIYRNGVIWWLGQIPTDLVEYPDAYYTYEVKLTAICGLSRLKNIPYDNDGATYTGRRNIVSHITEIINKLNLPLVEINTPNSILEVLCTWYETSCDFTGRSPLQYTDLAYDAFQEYDEYKVVKTLSCFEVLEAICRRFRLRIFQFGGKFWLKQITHLYSLYYYGYRQDAAFTAASVINSRVTVDASNRGNGIFRRLPAIRNITSVYKFKQGINQGNLLPPDITPGLTYILGEIAGGSGEQLSITGKVRLQVTAGAPDIRTVVVVFAISLHIDSDYCDGTVGEELVWNTSTTSRIYFKSQSIEQYNTVIMVPIEILTPEIPNSGTGYFNIAISHYEDETGVELDPDPSASFSFTANNNILQVKPFYAVDETANGTQRIISTNTVDGTEPVTSRVVTEMAEYIIGDGPRLYSAGRLKIWDGTNWVNSQKWIAPGADEMPIAELGLRYNAANAKNTREIYDFDFDDEFKPHQDLYFQSEQWMLLSGSFNPDLDRWRLVIMKIAGDYTNINISDLEEAESGSGSSSQGNNATVINMHNRLHSMVNALDHAAATGSDKGKLLGNNATTGLPEWRDADSYWQRSSTTLKPNITDDNVEVYVTGDKAAIIGTVDGYGHGVLGSSVNGAGVYGISTNETGVLGFSENFVGGQFIIDPSSTDTIEDVIQLNRQTTGTAANNIGASITVFIEKNNGSSDYASKIVTLLTNAAHGSVTSAFTWWLRNAGAALAEVMRLSGAGVLQTRLLALGTSNFTPLSTLDVIGSKSEEYRVQTSSSTTLSINDRVIICDTTSNAITVNLPSASGCARRTYIIRRYTGSNNVTIDPSGTQSLLGSLGSYTTLALTNNGDWVVITSNGTDWYIIMSNPNF